MLWKPPKHENPWIYFFTAYRYLVHCRCQRMRKWCNFFFVVFHDSLWQVLLLCAMVVFLMRWCRAVICMACGVICSQIISSARSVDRTNSGNVGNRTNLHFAKDYFWIVRPPLLLVLLYRQPSHLRPLWCGGRGRSSCCRRFSLVSHWTVGSHVTLAAQWDLCHVIVEGQWKDGSRVVMTGRGNFCRTVQMIQLTGRLLPLDPTWSWCTVSLAWPTEGVAAAVPSLPPLQKRPSGGLRASRWGRFKFLLNIEIFFITTGTQQVPTT